MIKDFHGNGAVVEVLKQMIECERIPQTMLFAGPEGVGKATLARRFATALLGDRSKIERDDLSLPANAALIDDREKWVADKRTGDPLLFSTHPDFVTFPPEGPLRQISIQQMRLLKERAQFKPLKGSRRVFLIDRIDRAGEHAANSLLKTLEEPPEHLILILTAENAYDLLPTIRSRAIIFHLGPLTGDQMREFAKTNLKDDAETRIALAGGSPGIALSLDLETYYTRRSSMLTLLEVAAGKAPFAVWVKQSEYMANRKQEKLDLYLNVLYVLLEDLLLLICNKSEIRNSDIRGDLEALSAKVSFEWIRVAVKKLDELVEQVRRNIQKTIALDAFALELRGRG